MSFEIEYETREGETRAAWVIDGATFYAAAEKGTGKPIWLGREGERWYEVRVHEGHAYD